MIDQQKRTLIKGDRPGSSWQIQPGTVPPSRALPVSPDRVGGTEYINQRRRKMLQDIRKKLNSSGADKYLVLMGRIPLAFRTQHLGASPSVRTGPAAADEHATSLT